MTVRGGHLQPLVLPLAMPATQGWHRNPCIARKRAHTFAMGRVHPQTEGIPRNGVISRFHGRRLPVVNGSDRADKCADCREIGVQHWER